MKDQNNKIIYSVVLCTFNREKHIKRCLDSLVSQDFPKEKFEIIVVDDGSTDGTKEIVKGYPVRLIEHKINWGIATARNTGLKAARGEVYVCFDDDCIAEKNWLTKLSQAYDTCDKDTTLGISGFIKLLKNNNIIDRYMQDIGYANPSPVVYGQGKNPVTRFYAYLKNMFSPAIQGKEKTLEVNEIWGANCSFPVKVLEAVKGWDSKMSGVEDTDLCDRIKKKFTNKKFICTKEAIIYHDHQLSLRGFLQKPYSRGAVNLNFYLQNSKIPPIFPFPLAILLLSVGLSLQHILYGIVSLIISTQLFYSWWLLEAIKKRKLYYLVFPYLQSGYELFSILGLLRGFIKNLIIVTPRKLLILLLLLGIAINVVILKNIQHYFSREILSILYLLFFPGLLVSWSAKIKYHNLWEFIIYITSISIAVLMLLGLSINYLLPYIQINSSNIPLHNVSYLHFRSIYIPNIHIVKPLAIQSVLFSLNTFLTFLWVYVFVSNNPIPVKKFKLNISIKSILIGLIPTTFPVLSILGAISLNNNNTNIFTMTMLGLTALYVLLLVVLRNKVSENIFAYSLFMIAISLLFMTSLRGWYITGHDVNLEYYVFQLTKTKGIWKMVNFQDPYNACLSITILPTIISNVSNVNDLYIYKVIYQVLFSLSIVATFIFIKKFINPFLAFLGTFSIISLPTFMTDMPMLNRQEIALLFFVLLLNTLFGKTFSIKGKWFLFLIFGLGLLLSHYSTTYIAMGLFIGTFLIHLPLRLVKFNIGIKKLIQKIDNKLGLIDNKPNLRLDMIIVLLIATVVWNVNITNTSRSITTTITKIVNDFRTSHFVKSKSDPTSYALLSSKAPSNKTLLQNYMNTLTAYVRKFNSDSAFLDKTVYSQYPVTNGSQVKLPLTSIGKKISSYKINVFFLNDQLKQVYAKLIQIFIIVGFIAIFFFKKHISNFEKEYFIFTLAFLIILITEVILPGGSIDYGILRLFQQGLILFSIPLLMGGLAIFSVFDFLHKSIKIYLISIFLIFFFLFLSGFFSEITGGYYPQLNLENSGFYYDAYYTHTKDIAGMEWLSKNRNKRTPVQSDWFAIKKIHTYENFYTIDGLIPSVIRINSYVYLSVSNLKIGQIIIYANGAPLYYKYPFDVLNENKNLIYSNGGVKIYR